MKKYEYVSINIAKKAMPKIYFGAKSKEHRKIIDQYAENGYTILSSDVCDVCVCEWKP